MKFVCNRRLFNTSHEFNRDTDNSKCNLATALLHHEFISEIYFDMNFISISIKNTINGKNIRSHQRVHYLFYQ